MKNTIKLLGIIALSAVIGFGLTSCGDDGGGDGSVTVGNWKWIIFSDQQESGSSTVEMDVNEADEKVTLSGNVALIPNQTYGYASASGTPNAETLSALKAADAISFKIKGDGKKYKLEIRTSDITNYNYYQIRFATVEDQEMEITIPYSWLRQENWGNQVVAFDKSKITRVAFHARAEATITKAGDYEFTVWDIKAGNASDVSMPYFNQGVYVSGIGDPIVKFEILEDTCIVTYKDQEPVTLPYELIDFDHDDYSHKLRFSQGSDWIEIFFDNWQWIVNHVACWISPNSHYTKDRNADAFNRQ